MAHLVTGHAGIEHIKPSDDGAFNIGICGNGQYVFPIGEQFGYEIISNNLIKIKSGELVNQGRHINIPVNNYDEVTIENGLQGVKRHDIIVMRYERNPDTSIESASLVVVKGASSANPSDPVVTQGNIYEGANVSDMPLYRVYLDGLNIEKVEKMFTVIPSLPAVNAKAEQNAEDIEAIKNDLTHKSIVVPISIDYEAGSMNACKVGNLCTVSWTGLIGISLTGWERTQIAQLPEGYRPVQTLMQSPLTIGGHAAAAGAITVYPDGRIDIVPTSTITALGGGHITYVTA